MTISHSYIIFHFILWGENMAKEMDFSYTVGAIDEPIDSRGNSVIMLRKLAWGSNAEKLEIRRWIIDIDSERANKGVTFLTEEGPHNLVRVMAEKGFGHTHEIINAIKDREDFDDALASIGKKAPKGKPSEEFYDPKEACGL